jgi:mRNA interferase RelE/StbE
MIVEYDKSFEKWLSKIKDRATLRKIEQAILQAEEAVSVSDISQAKKLTGFKKYYRIKIGNYRLGFERINKSTIRLIIIANRKDIYQRFP